MMPRYSLNLDEISIIDQKFLMKTVFYDHIMFSLFKDKIHVFAPPYNIPYIKYVYKSQCNLVIVLYAIDMMLNNEIFS
jgi:hypothetical protein